MQKIPYHHTGFFSKLMIDYLAQDEQLAEYYHHFPTIEGFKRQLIDKQHFSKQQRLNLVEVLEKQYQNIELSSLAMANIQLLKDEKTFTITTGHQLCLFTGPLYFLYKIVTTINLAKQLKKEFPEYHFVPVYWMATEDHDFEEINHFYTQKGKLTWHSEAAGGVGSFTTKGLEDVFSNFSDEIGNSNFSKELKELFLASYLNNETLSEATRHLVNQLFGAEGLVVLDADHQQLKSTFQSVIKDELLQQTAYRCVQKSSEKLAKSYNTQVTPRFINLFYLKEQLRERIVLEGSLYKVLNSNLVFTKEELLLEVENYPERFSPNVIMRPLYQEMILPNICYIGGGGELAYWFQLKAYFDEQQCPFPVLLLRNSLLLATETQLQKLEKLKISVQDLFLQPHLLKAKKTKQWSEFPIDFSQQKHFLKEQFKALKQLATQTDASFTGAVLAQEKKQLNGLRHLEKRLLKAQKRRFASELERIDAIQQALFPHGQLQERHTNFSVFYKEIGKELIPLLLKNIDPLDFTFKVVTVD